MANAAPSPQDVLDYQFKLHCRLKVFKNESHDEFKTVCNMVAAASRYGLIFVGTTTNNFQVIPLSEIGQLSAKDGEVSTYVRRIIEIPSKPLHISVNCDSTKLSVVVIKNGCATALIFEVVSFYKQQIAVINEIRLSSNPGINVIDTNWNPALPDIYTACKDDGSLGVYELKGGSLQIHELPSSAGATCFCWSPKGKQIAIGSRDGKITQYKPDLKAVKVVNPPPMEPQPIISLYWVSNYQFIGIFKTGNPDSPASLLVIDAPKVGNPVYTNYDDVCYSYGSNRPIQFYMLLLQHWNILMVTSSNSMEVGVMGLEKDLWTQWILGDSSRAELPLSASKQDTLPIGVALDTGNTQPFPYGEGSLPPAPRLLLLSHHGVLCCFNSINLKVGVPTICCPPEQVPDRSGVNQFVRGAVLEVEAKPVKPAPSKSEPTIQPSFQPPPVQPTMGAAPPAFATTPPTFASPPPTFASPPPTFGTPPPTFSTAPPAFGTAPPTSQPSLFGDLGGTPGSLFGNKPFSAAPKLDVPPPSTIGLKPLMTPNLSQPPPNMQPILNLPQTNPTHFQQIPVPQQTVQPQQKPTQPIQPFAPKPNVQPIQPVAKVDPIKPDIPIATELIKSEIDNKPSNERLPINAETEAMIAQLVREECVTLEAELKALIHRCRAIKIEVGSDGEATQMVKNTNTLSDFVHEITEISNLEAAEIHVLKQSLIQTWAWYEEARSRYTSSKDSALLALLQAQPLDPASQRQLSDIRQMIYYLDSQLTQANNSLDEQWDNFQDSCKSNVVIRLPTMETIYQSMVKQNATLQKQNYILKDIASRLKSQSRNQSNDTKVLISLDKSDNLEEELKKLHLNPDNLPNLQYSRVLDRQCKLTKTKSEKLYKLLAKRNVTCVSVIKPNLNDSSVHLTSFLQAPLSPIAPNKKPLHPHKLDFLMSTPKPLFPPISKPSSAFAPTAATNSLPLIGKVNSAVPNKMGDPRKSEPVSSSAQKHTLFGVSIPNASAATNAAVTSSGFSSVFTPSATVAPIKVSTPTTPLPTNTTTSFFAINSPSTTSQSSLFGVPKTEATSFSFKPTATLPSTAGLPKGLSITLSTSTTTKPVETIKSAAAMGSSLFGSSGTSIDLVTSSASAQKATVSPSFGAISKQPTSTGGAILNIPTYNVATTTSSLFATPAGANFASSTTTPTSSLFGSSSATPSAKMPMLSSPTSSIFSSLVPPGTTTPSMFGTAETFAASVTTPTSNIFGSSTASSSLFSTPATKATTESSAATSSPSLLAALTAPSILTATDLVQNTATTSSIFSATAASTPLIFSAAAVSTPSIFSVAAAASTPSIFSAAAASTPSSVFATPSTTAAIFATPSVPIPTTSASLFATPPPTSGSLFGGPVSSSGAVSPAAFSTAPPAFGASTVSVTTSSASTTTQASVFGGATTTTTSASVFGSIPTASAQSTSFGASASPTPANSGMSVFGTSFAGSPSTFGATTQESAFSSAATIPATATSSSSAFGATSAFGGTAAFGAATSTTGTSAFGSASPFGVNATDSAKASPFGGASSFGAVSTGTDSSGSLFGKPAAFGQGSVFGGAPASSTSTSVFGGAATGGAGGTTAFGSTAPTGGAFGGSSSVFGAQAATSASPFGAPANASPFGTSTQASSFNFANAASSSTPPSAFGSTAFGGGAFGSASPEASANSFSFSGMNMSANPTTTTASAGFGSNFGQAPANPFGRSTTQDQTKSPFGGGSLFGSPAATSASSVFGGSSSFVKPAAPGFGSPSTFGSPSAFGGQASFGSPSAFGSSGGFGSTAQPPGPFSGGASTQAAFGSPAFQKPASGFGAAPVFGSASPGFGASPSFGAQPGFGAPPAFGSPQKVFGGSQPDTTTAFGAMSPQNSNFGNLATQNTLGFGNLAQQVPSTQPSSFSGGGSSSFSSWR